MPKSKLNPALIPDDILVAEYEYIAATAEQSNEDRSRVASFYFVSVGSIVAAILGAQFAKDNLRGVSMAFSILFIVLTVLGALTIVIVQNGLNLNAVPTSAQNVVVGAIIVLAVGIDMWRVEIGQALSFLSPSKGASPTRSIQ